METATTNSEFLNDVQVAELLNVTVDAVRYWRTTGTGPTFFKFGRFVRYDRADVMAWVKSQAVGASS